MPDASREEFMSTGLGAPPADLHAKTKAPQIVA
jgi:hypothetical protein